MAGEIFRLSPLRLRVFRSCKLRYNYQYLEKRRARLRPQDTAGTLVHNVLSDFFGKAPPAQRTSEQLLSMFDQRWAALSPRYLRIPSVEGLRRRARAQLERFALQADLTASPLLIEAHFQVDLAPDVRLLGRIDRVDEEQDGSLTVLDYKTTETPDEIDPTQLYLYALMVEKDLQRPVSRGSFWYLEDGRVRCVDLDEAGKVRAAETALALARQMRSAREFPPNIGRRCAYCPYLSVCDYKQEIALRRQAEGW